MNNEQKEFLRENRYLVLKRKDIEQYLTPKGAKIIEIFAGKIAAMREGEGKPELKCVVIESDWPEYEEVWGMIQRRVQGTVSKPAADEPQLEQWGYHSFRPRFADEQDAMRHPLRNRLRLHFRPRLKRYDVELMTEWPGYKSAAWVYDKQRAVVESYTTFEEAEARWKEVMANPILAKAFRKSTL